MKKLLAIALVLVLALSSVSFASADSVIDTILTAGTTQAFTDQPVNDDDLTLIMQAGLATASAINQQPWYFVAVTNADVMAQLTGGGASAGMPANAPAGAMPEGMPAGAPADGMPAGAAPAAMPASTGAKAALGDSPAAIIIYMDENTKSPNASFDCGLAVQNMYIAAASLGYGVKIVSSPTMTLNGGNHDQLCELLGVDPSLKAVAVMLIGYPETATDGTTGATTRYDLTEKTSFIK